jgi:SsrA-binding protein
MDLVSNKKAFFDYHILTTFDAGIALKGTEVKSIKMHSASLQEAYITIKNNELFLVNCYVAPYKEGNIYNHEERREKKLLVHFYEITKIKKETQEKGYAIIPLSLYLNKGKIKLKFALAKGKKAFDKREKIKEKEEKRHIQRSLKSS